MTEHKAPRPSSKAAGDIQQVRVARLTKAHGLKGAIKLELYTDDPERRFTPGASFTLQVPTSSPWHGKLLKLTELKFYNSHPVAFFEGVDDRTAAEGLIKAILWVDQDPTELPAEKDAWYDYQLVGLRALRDGVEVGKVVRVDHFPAQDLLVIDSGDREVLVPFVAAIVPAVDIAAGTVTVTPPTGLFEDIVDDDPEPPPAAPAPAVPPESDVAAESDDAAEPDDAADPE